MRLGRERHGCPWPRTMDAVELRIAVLATRTFNKNLLPPAGPGRRRRSRWGVGPAGEQLPFVRLSATISWTRQRDPHPDLPGAWAPGVRSRLRYPLDGDYEHFQRVMGEARDVVDPEASQSLGPTGTQADVATLTTSLSWRDCPSRQPLVPAPRAVVTSTCGTTPALFVQSRCRPTAAGWR